MVVVTNWRMLPPKDVRRLPTERRLIVRKGQFIQGRFKQPELVFKVERHGMHLSTYDQAGNAWLRKQGPGRYWVVYVSLKV